MRNAKKEAAKTIVIRHTGVSHTMIQTLPKLCSRGTRGLTRIAHEQQDPLSFLDTDRAHGGQPVDKGRKALPDPGNGTGDLDSARSW
ncbi:hypothetical protein [Paracoccus seriniphilus]|uniref:hypothetical protein n=1 Tax=Paracoccus seriniphilus TaxID=184748 RepID=UPI0035626702